MTGPRIAAGLALSAVLAGCGWPFGIGGGGVSTGESLMVEQGRTRVGITRAEIGEPLFYNLWIARLKTNRSAHLERVEVLGAPAHFVIDRVWAAKIYDFPHEIIGEGRGLQEKQKLQPLLKHVDSVTLDPSCPPSAGCGPLYNPKDPLARDLGWYFLAEAHVTAKGWFVTSGIRVYYSVDGIHYQQTMPGIEIEAESSSAPMPPQPSSS